MLKIIILKAEFSVGDENPPIMKCLCETEGALQTLFHSQKFPDYINFPRY